MGFLDELKKLTQPFDDEQEFFDSDEDITHLPVPEDAAPAAEPAKKSSFFSGGDYGTGRSNDFGSTRPSFTSSRSAASAPGKVVNINASTSLKVVLVKPTVFEAAAEIADHLREKRAVVMNLEATDKDVARRLIDFLSGVAYAQDGKIRKVAVSTYIITPYNVDLMGDVVGEIESGSYIF